MLSGFSRLPKETHSKLRSPKSRSYLSANSQTYYEERNREVDENIEKLKNQGITFHHNRKNRKKNSAFRTFNSHHDSIKQKPPLNWKFIFMLCCLTIMIYYAFTMLL